MYPIDGAHLIFTVLSQLALYVFISLCSGKAKIYFPVTSTWHKAPPCYKYFMHKKDKKAKKIVPHKGSTVLTCLKTKRQELTTLIISRFPPRPKEQEHFDTLSPVASLIYGTCLSCPPLRHILSANLEA